VKNRFKKCAAVKRVKLYRRYCPVDAFKSSMDQRREEQEAKDKEYAAKRAEYEGKLVRIRKERDAAVKANEEQREAGIAAKRKEVNAKVEAVAQEQAAREAKFR
jgi:peptidoglycan hydrolase CwlO-like protein